MNTAQIPRGWEPIVLNYTHATQGILYRISIKAQKKGMISGIDNFRVQAELVRVEDDCAIKVQSHCLNSIIAKKNK